MENLNSVNFEYLGYKLPKLGKISLLYIYRKIDPEQFTKDWLNDIKKFSIICKQ